MELTHRGLVGLEPVELGVLCEQRVAERGDGTGGVPAPGEVAVDDRARLVYSPFLVPAALEVGEVANVVATVVSSRERRQSGGGDVQEAVEVDPQRPVVDAAQQLSRRGAAGRLMEGVR